LVTDRRQYRQFERLPPQCPAGRGASHPAAAALRGVSGDRLGTPGRAAREQVADLVRHPRLELAVGASASCGVPVAPLRARLLVLQALPLGALERVLLD
jgi:hypothetical protein